jgi:hypothetical protein
MTWRILEPIETVFVVKKQKQQVEIFRQQAASFWIDDISSIIKRGNRTYWQKREGKTCFSFTTLIL